MLSQSNSFNTNIDNTQTRLNTDIDTIQNKLKKKLFKNKNKNISQFNDKLNKLQNNANNEVDTIQNVINNFIDDEIYTDSEKQILNNKLNVGLKNFNSDINKIENKLNRNIIKGKNKRVDNLISNIDNIQNNIGNNINSFQNKIDSYNPPLPEEIQDSLDDVLCDATCQRKRELDELQNELDELIEEEQELKPKISSVYNRYNILKNGPEWLSNTRKQKMENKLLEIKKQKQREFENLIYKYNNQLILINTQNNLVNKLDLLINKNNKDSSLYYKEIDVLEKNIIMNNRKTYLNKKEYNQYLKILYKLRFYLVILLLLLFICIVYYIFTIKK